MDIDPTYCSWDTDSFLLIVSDNVFGSLVYYSHLLPILCLSIFSLILLFHNRRNRAVLSLAFISFSFTLWSLSDLVLWATANPAHTMFFWSIIVHFEVFIYIGAFFFIHNYLLDKSPSLRSQLIIFLGYIPILLFAHTSLNLVAFDYTNCWREAVEGPLVYYVYFYEILIVMYIVTLGIKTLLEKATHNKSAKEILLATLGTTLFLASFSLGNIIGTLEVDWEIGQYGLFAIPLFIGMLTYLVTHYHSFNVKLLTAQLLVISITVLVLSILFVRTIENVRLITFITVIFTTIIGFSLIASVRNEVRQREEIEKLAKQLAGANKRLRELDKAKSEFVSIASHQLRSPLTSMRGYSSMLLEGSYGQLPQKAKEVIAHIADSAKNMAASVEDYLDVSRIESGNMKFDNSDFNLRDEVEHVVDDKRQEAIQSGLLLLFKTELTKKGVVYADKGKVLQIVHNLINNSMKYTKKGSITVYVHDNPTMKKVFVSVSDTGIGMSQETIEGLFGKFARAKNANSVNIHGTGLGLYVARSLAQAMDGDVTATSPGDGKGSTFTLELPLKM